LRSLAKHVFSARISKTRQGYRGLDPDFLILVSNAAQEERQRAPIHTYTQLSERGLPRRSPSCIGERSYRRKRTVAHSAKNADALPRQILGSFPDAAR
jgi:hypothetical protein